MAPLNKLSRIGLEAMRVALLAELRNRDWHLTKVADHFEVGGLPNLIRQIHRLGLTGELEAARAAGLIRRGCARR